MKRRSILSQNWFPGRLSMAMKAKYPQSTDVGIFFIAGIAKTDAATMSDCKRLLTLCSLTRTGRWASMCFSGSNVSFAFSPFITASFKSSSSLTTEVICKTSILGCRNHLHIEFCMWMKFFGGGVLSLYNHYKLKSVNNFLDKIVMTISEMKKCCWRRDSKKTCFFHKLSTNRRKYNLTVVHFYEHSLHLAIDFRVASILPYAFLCALHHLPSHQLQLMH